MARPLRERFVDEQGDHAVLDQVGALRRDRHADEYQQIGGHDPERDGDLESRRPYSQPLRYRRRNDQEAAEQEEARAQVEVPQRRGQRPRQAEGGVDRRHDGQRPGPEAPLPIRGEERRPVHVVHRGLRGSVSEPSP